MLYQALVGEIVSVTSFSVCFETYLLRSYFETLKVKSDLKLRLINWSSQGHNDL